MKIMHLIHGLNVGGVQALVKDYALNFDRKENEIIILCLKHIKNTPYEKILVDNGVRIIFVEDNLPFANSSRGSKRFINRVCKYLKVKRIIRKESPDILHTHLGINNFVKFAKPKPETVIFHTVHTDSKKMFDITKKDGKRNFKEMKWLMKHYKVKLIVLHNDMKNEIDKIFNISDSVILNNGINISKYRKIEDKVLVRKSLNIPEDAFVVGHVGRFSEVKNHDFLVDIFREIKNKNKKAFLLMVGSGEKKTEIETKLHEYRLDGSYLILSNRSDIPNILNIMDVFAFPSEYEGLGMALVEAQEAKLPCFVSDTVPNHAVISNLVTMLPLNAGVGEWVEKIINYKKPKNIVLNDKDWDIGKITKQLENLYMRALDDKKNKMNFVLLYNCPIKKCDKLWLYDGLRKYGKVKIIPCLSHKTYFIISRFFPKLKIGKIVVVLLTFLRSLLCIIVSNKDDIVVTWANKQGYILENMCRRLGTKRKIVSFMWIDFSCVHSKAVARSFRDENFMPIINNPKLKDGYSKFFGLKTWNGLFLPDVFDDKQNFAVPTYKKKEKYIFAGGSNNRDWDLLIEVAKETPDLKYIIVSDKGKIKGERPANVIVKENLPSKEYYDLMRKAFVTICPLKEDRTSGLINILKSAQFGIPCICTSLAVVELYYSSDSNILLYAKGKQNDLRDKIFHVYNFDEKEYIKVARDFQNYIENNFTPEKNIEKLIKELKNRGWV